MTRQQEGRFKELPNSARASQLAKELKAFASSDRQAMEATLGDTVSRVLGLKPQRETLALLLRRSPVPGFNELLGEAVKKSLRTRLVTRKGMESVWGDGSHVLVALKSNGTLLGFDAAGEKDKTLAFAIVKALSSMMLDRAGRSEGMLNLKNVDYLEKLGLELGRTLFLGGVPPVTINGDKVYFAGGGIHPSKGYVAGVINEVPRSKDTLAGVLEMTFARITVEHMLDQNMRIKGYPEPELPGLLRLAH